MTASPTPCDPPSPTSSDSLLERIKSARESLRNSEKLVADYILAQPNAVVDYSIAQMAEAVGVSEPTVARFCQGLGIRGFKDFKLSLAKGLASGVRFVHADVKPGDPAAEIISKVFDRSIGSLMRVRNQLDPASVQRAAQLLGAARKIEIYGLGNSGIVAQDAQHKFFRLSVPTVAYSDPHIHGMAATMLRPGDVLIAISSSGRTLDLLRSVELARQAGADVIAITSGGTPLAKQATVALFADLQDIEDPDVYTPMTSRLAHLAIIDVLAVAVALARGPQLLAQLERTKETLKHKRVRGFDQP